MKNINKYRNSICQVHVLLLICTSVGVGPGPLPPSMKFTGNRNGRNKQIPGAF